MKRIFLLLSVIILMNSAAIAGDEGVMTYSEKNKFGLKTTSGTVVTNAEFKKLIRLGNSSWIVQKGSNFGLIDNEGNYILQPKYTTAERLVGRFAKFCRGSLCGLWSEKGEVLVPQEYSSIGVLYGRMFLVEKNFKYGLIGFDGRVILEPTVDDIYMPKPNVMMLSHNGKWYEIEQVSGGTFELPSDIRTIKENENFKITEIISKPVPSAGYGVVSAGDYCLKVFSSVSPAYEQTIDELVLKHGADVAGILLKSTWLVKFPFVYAKNYVNTVITPNNGPLSDVKASLKSKIKEEN